jgi:hypothetical protein
MAIAETTSDENKKEVSGVVMDQEVPLFSGSTKFGNLVFIWGRSTLYEILIAIPKPFCRELEKELVKAGSSKMF